MRRKPLMSSMSPDDIDSDSLFATFEALLDICEEFGSATHVPLLPPGADEAFTLAREELEHRGYLRFH